MGSINSSRRPSCSTGFTTPAAWRASVTALPAPPIRAPSSSVTRASCASGHLAAAAATSSGLTQRMLTTVEVQLLGYLQGRIQQRAERQDGNLSGRRGPPARTLRNSPLPKGSASPGPASMATPAPAPRGIAHGHRVVLLECTGQELGGIRSRRPGRPALICGMQRRNGNVVGAGMCGAVGTDEPGAIEREHHRQVLQRHVMDQLVVTALQEGGVDGHHRLQPLAGHDLRRT
jgi:hypothetical protein